MLVLQGCSRQEKEKEAQDAWKEMSLQEHMKVYEDQGLDRKEAMKRVAKDRGVGKREIYQAFIGGNMNIELKPGERLDDLQRKWIQDHTGSRPFLFWNGCGIVVRVCKGKARRTGRGSGNRYGDHTDPAGSKKQGRILYWIGDPARRVQIWHHAVSSSMIFRNGFTL